MSILRLLWNNLRRGVATLRYPDRPPLAENFRGLVRFNPTRCTGCSMCRFRCTAGAITFTSAGREFTWTYDPAQCTFCGRCVEGCKDCAISQDSGSPPIYTEAGSLIRTYTIQRKTPPYRPKGVPAATGTHAGDAS